MLPVSSSLTMVSAVLVVCSFVLAVVLAILLSSRLKEDQTPAPIPEPQNVDLKEGSSRKRRSRSRHRRHETPEEKEQRRRERRERRSRRKHVDGQSPADGEAEHTAEGEAKQNETDGAPVDPLGVDREKKPSRGSRRGSWSKRNETPEEKEQRRKERRYRRKQEGTDEQNPVDGEQEAKPTAEGADETYEVVGALAVPKGVEGEKKRRRGSRRNKRNETPEEKEQRRKERRERRSRRKQESDLAVVPV